MKLSEIPSSLFPIISKTMSFFNFLKNRKSEQDKVDDFVRRNKALNITEGQKRISCIRHCKMLSSLRCYCCSTKECQKGTPTSLCAKKCNFETFIEQTINDKFYGIVVDMEEFRELNRIAKEEAHRRYKAGDKE